MKFVDVSNNPEISALTELSTSAAYSADPREALQSLTASLARGRAYAEVMILDDPPAHYLVRRLITPEEKTAHVPVSAPATGGFIGRLTLTPMPKIVREIDLAGDPVLPPELSSYRSAMAAPVFVNQSVHEWVILFDQRPDAFTPEELSELLLRTRLVGTSLGNLQIERRLFDANLRIQREINDIAAIQQALLPHTLPQIPHLQVAASYEAASQAGGDIYDLVPINLDGRTQWAIFIGDVAGHGPASAVVMTMLHCLLHACPGSATTPAQILSHLNSHICAKGMRAGIFATAFLGLYDPDSGVLSYASAGHLPPLLVGPNDAQFQEVNHVNNEPLGLIAEASYEQTRVTLRPGQLLLLYTDGITEARSPRGQFFEMAGILQAIGFKTCDPEIAIHRIRSAVLAHTANPHATDDQTLVAIRVS